MAPSQKRPRSHESDEAAEDEHSLIRLLHRRCGDVEKLMAHIKNREEELSVARTQRDEAVRMLDQIRAGSRDKYGDRNKKLASRRESSNGEIGHASVEDHHSPGRRGGISSSPLPSNKTAVSTRDQPKQSALGQSPADWGQDESNKGPSGVESDKSNKSHKSDKLDKSNKADKLDKSDKSNKPKKSSKSNKSNEVKGVVQLEHVDLIAMIRSQSKATKLDTTLPSYIPLQHKRKPRSLVLSPAIDHLCATSALDGVVNFWQITQEKGFGVSLSHTVDCLSPVGRRWPENLAWHPLGKTLFAVYSADGGPQIGIIRTSKKKPGIKFLDDKPHEKGIINSIQFLPWSNGSQFVTGGCDHGVVIWTEKEGGWQPHPLHRKLHSSAVTGVAGILHKQYVISSGMDKRVFAVDPSHSTATFQHLLDSKALGVQPNPADFNLLMVQTGTPGHQLRLFDIRVQRTELHGFGWKQEAGDSQSGLISQSWSPDGLCCASGSTDPKIHIFDIRYNSREPIQTLDAHQKRVFKAAWHPNLPLLLSISSDLFVGMHRLL